MRPSQRAKKTRAEAKISKNLAMRQSQNKKSLPECWFDTYQQSRRMELEWGKSIPVVDPDNGDKYDFEIDFIHEAYQFKLDDPRYDYAIEIDGAKWHKKASKEQWKNELKLATGLKQVIHVPAVMCKDKWALMLDEMLPQARASGEPVVYLDKVASGLI